MEKWSITYNYLLIWEIVLVHWKTIDNVLGVFYDLYQEPFIVCQSYKDKILVSSAKVEKMTIWTQLDFYRRKRWDNHQIILQAKQRCFYSWNFVFSTIGFI